MLIRIAAVLYGRYGVSTALERSALLGTILFGNAMFACAYGPWSVPLFALSVGALGYQVFGTPAERAKINIGLLVVFGASVYFGLVHRGHEWYVPNNFANSSAPVGDMSSPQNFSCSKREEGMIGFFVALSLAAVSTVASLYFDRKETGGDGKAQEGVLELVA